jgi:hypothetical protein
MCGRTATVPSGEMPPKDPIARDDLYVEGIWRWPGAMSQQVVGCTMHGEEGGWCRLFREDQVATDVSKAVGWFLGCELCDSNDAGEGCLCG